MKPLKTIILFAICTLQLTISNRTFAQCLPLIAIDGNNIVADENNVKGLKLPAWLTAGQTIAKGQFVYSISVMEFTVNGNALDFIQNKKVTTIETVPTGKTWKIESIMKDMALPSSSNGVYIYAIPGTYTFTTPACITVAQVQVWGAGGGGGCDDSWWCTTAYGAGGGGAGGYSEGAYQLAASTNYTITVGTGGTAPGSSNGGTGGTSTFIGPSTLTATGGTGGTAANCNNTAGGAGGTGSGGQINFIGQTGVTGVWTQGGKGGNAPNGGGVGGNGGTWTSNTGILAGADPGGGGGGGCSNLSQGGRVGGSGKVIITLGTGASKVPCVTLYQYSSTACTSSLPAPCPSGWTDGGCGSSTNGPSGWNYVRTCYRCD